MGGPGSGRRKGVSFGINLAKMRANRIPKALKKKWSKSGGVDNPVYQKWIKKHWT